jgi:hypothetical protein
MDRTANWCSRGGWFTLADSCHIANSPAIIGIDQRPVVTRSAPRHPTDPIHSFASANRLWPFWEQPMCLHCHYICRFLICPRESALRIEERVTTSSLHPQMSFAMVEVTEAMAWVFGACVFRSDWHRAAETRSCGYTRLPAGGVRSRVHLVATGGWSPGAY